MRRAVAALLATLAAPAFAAVPAPDPLATAIKSHITFLADDAMQGRGLGEPGNEIAANYVAAEFARLGLTPAGSGGGWFQRISFDQARFTSPQETMTFANGANAAVWKNGKDMSLSPGSTAGAETITAPLVFVGHGIKDASLGIDDFAGLDLKGKIAVALSGAHPGMNSETAAHLARSAKPSAALAAGAIGLIQVRTLTEAARAPWEKSVSRARNPRRILIGPDGRPLGEGAGLRVRASISDEAATQLFAGSPMDFAAVRAAAAKGPVKGFDLPGTVTIERAQDLARVTSPNVIGILPGTSKALADQHILVSAHLDHVGTKPAGSTGDVIFNGAMDNASGIATMIETARAMAARPGKRSIIFLATTAEESGLLGAEYFARSPAVPIDNIVAAVNIDMPILTCNFGDIVAFGADRSTIAAAVNAAARAEGVTVSPDPQPEEAVFTRSDHYPLVRAGVPAVFLKTGWKDARGGTTCKDAERLFRLSHYHEVSDDLGQPFDWPAAAKFVRLNTGIIRRLADAPKQARWYEGDYFGNAFAAGSPKAAR